MRRRSRIRRVLKWVGTVVCVLIGAAWFWSGWYLVRLGPTSRFKQEWLGGEPIPNNYESVSIGGGIIQAAWVEYSKRNEFAAFLLQLSADDQGEEELPPVLVAPFLDPPKFLLVAPSINDVSTYETTAIVPLWVGFAIVAIPTAFLWWRDRGRIRPGHCQRCGYDLTGNVSGVCPECGTAIDGKVDR